MRIKLHFVPTVLVAVTLVLTGCASAHNSVDFLRHKQSNFGPPLSGGDFYWFDVRLSGESAAEDDLAEAERIKWLEAWLAQQKRCMAGYKITDRRPFEFLEHNPGRYDLRYKVECSSPQG